MVLMQIWSSDPDGRLTFAALATEEEADAVLTMGSHAQNKWLCVPWYPQR